MYYACQSAAVLIEHEGLDGRKILRMFFGKKQANSTCKIQPRDIDVQTQDILENKRMLTPHEQKKSVKLRKNLSYGKHSGATRHGTNSSAERNTVLTSFWVSTIQIWRIFSQL